MLLRRKRRKRENEIKIFFLIVFVFLLFIPSLYAEQIKGVFVVKESKDENKVTGFFSKLTDFIGNFVVMGQFSVGGKIQFNGIIPDQSFYSDSSSTINLSLYFINPSNGVITYSYLSGGNINIGIVDNILIITSINSWEGITNLTIIGIDENGNNATSNLIIITISKRPSEPTTSSGGSSGGSSRGNCVENWNCEEYGPCIKTIQKRICTDLNNCGTTVNKPQLARSCFIRKEKPKVEEPKKEETTKVEEVSEVVKEVEKGVSFVVYGIIGVFVIFFFLLIPFLLLYRRANKKKHEVYVRVLLPRVREALRAGHSRRDVMVDLTYKGWPKEVVKKVFRKL